MKRSLAAALLCAVLSGCAAVSNPVGDAVSVRHLPAEVLGRRKEEERTIPLPMLRQKPPETYRLAAGDVLGVWIEGVLGDKATPPPLHIPEQGGQPPAFGYPFPIREDGTLPLPLVAPIKVDGLTIAEAQEAIIKAYTVDKKILVPGRERIVVTLMRPRTYHVLVVRQDTGAIGFGAPTGSTGGLLGQTKRGTGQVIDLPAYENDVLNALTRTGGLPGLDAANEVIIERGSYTDFADPLAIQHCLEPNHNLRGGDGSNSTWIRIPLRQRPGEPPPFKPEDVVLRNGDILFIEARDTEVFYTGGLLPSHQYALPRDYDLDVVQAISFVNGPFINGGQSGNNLSGAVLVAGLGFPSPSLITILRKTPGGGQIPIRVTLDRALRDPRERVLIQPGDVIILQETVAEAVTRYVSNQLKLNLFGTFIRQNDLLGTANLNVP